MASVPILIVPGYQNSGPGHWQTLWEAALPGARRVQMPSWDQPSREGWVAALDAAVAACGSPPILVAHSLGCVAVAHWAQERPRPVQGALLAAPADVERPDAPPALHGFRPLPSRRLPFRALLAASTNDPYLSGARAEALARVWGARLEPQGAVGHLNPASGHGPWPEGERLLAILASWVAS